MRFSVLDMLKRVSLTLSNPFQIFVLIFVPTCSSPPFSLFLSLPSSSSSAFLAATRRDNDKTWLRARNGSCYALRSRHHLGGSLLLHAHFPTLPSPAAAPDFRRKSCLSPSVQAAVLLGPFFSRECILMNAWARVLLHSCEQIQTDQEQSFPGADGAPLPLLWFAFPTLLRACLLHACIAISVSGRSSISNWKTLSKAEREKLFRGCIEAIIHLFTWINGAIIRQLIIYNGNFPQFAEEERRRENASQTDAIS